MSFWGSQYRDVPLGFIVERESIIAEAKRLRDRAAFLQMTDEVAEIVAPSKMRKPGRQKGSRSKALAVRRYALWSAFLAAKEASPESSDFEISERLFAKGKLEYGQSAKAIASHIAAMKAEINAPSLLESAGRPKRKGRPMVNPI